MLSEATNWWQLREMFPLIFMVCAMLTMVVCIWLAFRRDLVKEIGHAIQVFGVFGGVIGLFSGAGATFFLSEKFLTPQVEAKALTDVLKILSEGRQGTKSGNDLGAALKREFGQVDPSVLEGFVAFADRNGAAQPDNRNLPEDVCSFSSNEGHGLAILRKEAGALSAEVRAELAHLVFGKASADAPPLSYDSIYPDLERFQLRELLRSLVRDDERRRRLESFAKSMSPTALSGADWLARATKEDIRAFLDSEELNISVERRSHGPATTQLVLQSKSADPDPFVSRIGVEKSKDNKYIVSGLAFNEGS